MKGHTHDRQTSPEGGLAAPADPAPADRAPSAAAPPDFETVYAHHFAFACRSLRLLGVAPASLEDAAQDVFGVVLRRLPELSDDAPLRTWIFAIVQRVAANQRRSQRRRQRPLKPLLEEPLMSPDPSPEDHAEAAQAAARVQSFCDGLDEGHRAVFVLALIEDVPAREIAPALGIPLFTVYSRVRSLREALKRFFEQTERDT